MIRRRPTNRRNPIGKTFQLLSLMLEGKDGSWGVRELARASGLPPTTVHRLLASLENEGLVSREPESEGYRIGLEFYRLAWRAEAQFPIRDVAIPFMRSVVADCSETVFLGLYDPTRLEMMFVAVAESSHPLRYFIPLNQWIPVYTSASGMAIMAFLPRQEREQIVKHTQLAPLTEYTITDPILLEKELVRIRATGYACTHSQRTVGAVGVATPIWGHNNRVIGDLVITIPEQRFDASQEPELAKLLIHYSKCISEHLGARMPTQNEIDELYKEGRYGH